MSRFLLGEKWQSSQEVFRGVEFEDLMGAFLHLRKAIYAERSEHQQGTTQGNFTYFHIFVQKKIETM